MQMGSVVNSLVYVSCVQIVLLIVIMFMECKMFSMQIVDSMQYLKDGVENVCLLFMLDEGKKMICEVDVIYLVWSKCMIDFVVLMDKQGLDLIQFDSCVMVENVGLLDDIVVFEKMFDKMVKCVEEVFVVFIVKVCDDVQCLCLVMIVMVCVGVLFGIVLGLVIVCWLLCQLGGEFLYVVEIVCCIVVGDLVVYVQMCFGDYDSMFFVMVQMQQ